MASPKLEKLVKITVAIQVITLLLCYLSWVLDGCDPFIPFISDTDTNPASSWAFTIGFTLTGALTLPLSIQFYNARRRWAEQNNGSGIENMNLLSAISVAISGMSIIWISYTPWHEQMELHMVQARVIFGGLTIWALLSTVISLKMFERNIRFSSLYRTRRSWTIFSLICLLGLVISVYSYAGTSLSIPAGHMDTVLECSDLGHPSLSVAAFFEWLMVIGFAGVSYTGAQEVLLIDQ
tara:strand:- start:1107 stop:1817 length:711 start_codon:yes stop_codon:yes gene_type:complete